MKLDDESLEMFISKDSKYYNETDCCIFVYDSTNHLSFENIQKWYDFFIEENNKNDKHYYSPRIDKMAFLLIGNKSDLPNKTVDPSEAQKFAQEHQNMFFFETSAKTGENIEEALKTVIRKGVLCAKYFEFKIPSSVVVLETKEDKERRIEREYDNNCEKILKYIRFLEDRLSIYEKVEPITFHTLEAMIKNEQIEISQNLKIKVEEENINEDDENQESEKEENKNEDEVENQELEEIENKNENDEDENQELEEIENKNENAEDEDENQELEEIENMNENEEDENINDEQEELKIDENKNSESDDNDMREGVRTTTFHEKEEEEEKDESDSSVIEETPTLEEYAKFYILLLNYAHCLEKRLNNYENFKQFNLDSFKKYTKTKKK